MFKVKQSKAGDQWFVIKGTSDHNGWFIYEVHYSKESAVAAMVDRNTELRRKHDED
jgi:hypothetical protein